MQKEPIRDLDVVGAALDAVTPDTRVAALLGVRNLVNLYHCAKSVATAHSGTAQLAAYNSLLTFVGDFLLEHRGVFADEAFYDEIRDALNPSIGQLRKSTTPEELGTAYQGLQAAIAGLAQSPEPLSAGSELTPPASDADRIQALEQENLQLHRRIAELEAARRAYASEFPLTEDGEPDVGSIHANIRKLKADLAKAV